MESLNAMGQPSRFSCPECSGVLWEVNDSRPRRYRCNTGHGYTLRALAHTQDVATDETLWSAMRALHEREALLRELATEGASDTEGDSKAALLELARNAADHAEEMRRMIQAE